MDLASNPIWQRLTDRDRPCPGCGVAHGGLFDLAMERPDIWQGDRVVGNSEIEPDGHCLSDDLCVVEGRHYFVRGLMLLPIKGAPNGEDFGFGVWSSLSRENFETYRQTFASGPDDPRTSWFGWFANALKGYPDTINLKCRVRPQSGHMRPLIDLEATDHPLAVDQRMGISIERIAEIYAAYGHDFAD